ncbi:MAG: hypothetical protein ACTSPY_18395 [Candidatus Helarchaeota archaeon]
MIECKNKKGKIIGYVEGTQYLDKKKKLWGYLDDNIAKAKDGFPLLILKDNGNIALDDGEVLGYLKDNKIYNINDALIYQFIKDEQQIQNNTGQLVLHLEGSTEEIEKLTNLDYFGITAIILELFA